MFRMLWLIVILSATLNQFWQNIYKCFVLHKTICDRLKYHTLHLTETSSRRKKQSENLSDSQAQRRYTDETSVQRGHAKLKSKLSFVFPRVLSHARSLQRFLFSNPLRPRETPRWALPCVSNEFTWHPTVYQRHFLPVYVRVRRTHAYIRIPMCLCVCARGSASMWAEIPCSGRCWTIFPWPPRDTKLGMIIPYLPTEGRAVPSCRLLSSTRPRDLVSMTQRTFPNNICAIFHVE